MFTKKTKFQQKKQDYIEERPTKELMKEYREKHPTVIQRWQQRRLQQQQQNEELKKSLRAKYQKEYVRASHAAIKTKARQDAKTKYGQTSQQRQQRIGNMFNEIGDIFGTTPQKKQTQTQKRSKKHKKTATTKKSFDFTGFDDIGDIF